MITSSIAGLMLMAFCECLVLVGIHSYLGLHVIRRKVIFVDLALAQLAVLGATVGVVSFGFSPTSPAAHLFSLLFAILGAGVFAVTRLRNERVPQEAIIGLVFALAAATAILLIAQNDAKSLRKILTGTILFLDWSTILFAAVLYGAIGLVHYLFRERFLLLSEHPDEAERQGMRVAFWDFLFYLSFGVVISISVNTAGVLLVFVFLVGPAVLGMLITDRLLYQLLIGWALGTLVSFLGLAFAYFAEFPSGPSVVCLYGVVLILCGSTVAIVKSSHRRRALKRVLLGSTAVLLVGAVSYLGIRLVVKSPLAHGGGHHHHHHHDHSHEHATPKKEVETLLRRLVADPSQQEKLLGALTERDQKEIEDAFQQTDDGELKLMLADRMAALDRDRGAAMLVSALEQVEFPFIRSQIFDAITELSGQTFAYDPEADDQKNEPALEQMRQWAQNGSSDGGTK